MKYKFRRYKVNYKKKDYYILIPFEFDNIWLVDWSDDWYGGAWLEANIRCMKYLLACFCILAFNPYVIIYLPIRKNKRPNTFAYSDNCEYDVVFRSTKVYVKDKDLKNIVTNLKYVKWTTYKFSFDLERMKRYFHKKIKAIENIPDYKILVNADNHLNGHIAFYSFPQVWYQKISISMVEYFFEVIRENDWSYCYNEKYDTFTCSSDNFVYYGKRKDKSTYTHPPLTLYVELYDINMINKYKKEKVYLVDKNIIV